MEFIKKLRKSCKRCFVLERKEIENYLLDMEALTKAIKIRLEERGRSNEAKSEKLPKFVEETLRDCTDGYKGIVLGQLSANRVRYFRGKTGKDQATIVKEAVEWLEKKWENLDERLKIVPGKKVLSDFNRKIQSDYKVSLSPALIIRCISVKNMPTEFKKILRSFDEFSLG